MKPLHKSDVLDFFSVIDETELALPYMQSGVSAGFPSPADDFIDMGIDLNKALIKNPSATFYAKAKGVSLIDIGIDDGDLLVIDKSLEPQNGKLAVCYIDGEFTGKRIKIENGECYLMPANKNYKPIKVTKDNEFIVWGIIIHVIKSF